MSENVCPNCKAKIEEDSKFCDQCGYHLTNEIDNTEYIISPSFNFGVHMLNFTIIFIVLLVFLIISTLNTKANYPNDNLMTEKVGISIVILMYIGLFINRYFTYRKSQYKILKDKIIYSENFGETVNRKIDVSSIKQIDISQNMFDRIFNYGRIIFYTNNNTAPITLKAIKNPQQVYNKIKEKISI